MSVFSFCMCGCGFCSCGSQLGAVLLQQLETELAEDLQEGQVWVLLFPLMRVPEGKAYPVSERKKQQYKHIKDRFTSWIEQNILFNVNLICYILSPILR